jgi:hypothetical protein
MEYCDFFNMIAKRLTTKWPPKDLKALDDFTAKGTIKRWEGGTGPKKKEKNGKTMYEVSSLSLTKLLIYTLIL